MAKFTVKRTAILHNGKRYEIGSTIELTAEEAEIIALNLTPVADTATKQEAGDAITEADVKAAEANIAEAEKMAEAEKTAKAKTTKAKA